MPEKPITSISDLTRDEYTALAAPLNAQRKRLLIAPVLHIVLSILWPTIVYAVYMAFKSYTTPPGQVPRFVFNVSMARLWQFYLTLQVLSVLANTSFLWVNLHRPRTQVQPLFPDGTSIETLVTQIGPYGILQTCGGACIVSPWDNVIRVDEMPGAFVLQLKNKNTAYWGSWTNLVCIPKSTSQPVVPEISVDWLEQMRDASKDAPNYTWNADLFSRYRRAEANSDSPFPFDISGPNSGIGVPLTGAIYLPTIDALVNSAKLSFRYNQAAIVFEDIRGNLVVPSFLLVCVYNSLADTSLYGRLAVAPFVVLLIALIAYSDPIIAIDRKKSQFTLDGIRYASISDINAITVVESPSFGKGLNAGQIKVTNTNGKSNMLNMRNCTSVLEANIVATILGKCLAESQCSSRD